MQFEYGSKPESARYKFAAEAAERNYSPAQLNAAIKRACGRVANKGRPPEVPASDIAVQLVAEEAVAWAKRCKATWEKLMSMESVPKKELLRLRSLLAACQKFCAAANQVIGKHGSDKERAKLIAVAEGAHKNMAKAISKGIA